MSGAGLRQAVAFLTVAAGSAAPTPRACPWFPLVGAGLGLIVGLSWALADEVWAASMAAAVVVAVDLALTGLLHLDGLADTADGLLPHLDRRRRLAVMATPDVGAFGVAAVAVVLLLRWAALAALAVPAPLLVAALWCASRSLMALAVARLRYARDTGLATAFIGGGGRAGAVGMALAVGASWWWRPVGGPVAVLVGLAAGAALTALAVRRLGGFTGDVLGAAGMTTETVGLVVAAARW